MSTTDDQTKARPARNDDGTRPDMPQWYLRLTARPRVLVAACAAIAGAWAFLGSRLLLPYLSNNHDEAVYLLQADALRHGHLFPRAPAATASPDAFLPWLTALEGTRFVPKYAPVFPSMLAAGRLIFGTERAALALIAGGIIVMTYLLATEVLDDRRQAAFASLFMLCTPLLIVQSLTYLPYSASLLMLTTFAFMYLRGLRTRHGPWLLGAGVLLGLALFARPYDAVLFGIPFAVYLLVHERHSLRSLLSRSGWLVLGLIPPVVGLLAFNAAATGSASQSPFSLIDSRDTVGFGERSMDPANPTLRYTPSLGVTGLSRHATLTMFWCFGGLLVVGCAIYLLVRTRGRGRGPAALLGSVVVLLPLGYLFFWGTYGAIVWGAPWYLGPYYYMPIFVPLAVLGAGGFVALLRNLPRVATVALIGMLGLSAFVTGRAMMTNWEYTVDDRRLNAALADADLDDTLVFLPAFYGPRLLHPYATAANNWDVSGDTIYAVDRGKAANASVIADFPDRRPYLAQITGKYRARPPDPTLATALVPFEVLRADTIEMTVAFDNPRDLPVTTVTVTVGDRVDTFVLDQSARLGTPERLDLAITTTATTASGPVVSQTTAIVPGRTTGEAAGTAGTAPGTGEILVEIGTAARPGDAPRIVYTRSYGLAQRQAMLTVPIGEDDHTGPLPGEPITMRAR